MQVRRVRQHVLSFKVTPEIRSLVERLAAELTIRRGKRHTMTDVVEAAIRLFARKEKIGRGAATARSRGETESGLE